MSSRSNRQLLSTRIRINEMIRIRGEGRYPFYLYTSVPAVIIMRSTLKRTQKYIDKSSTRVPLDGGFSIMVVRV